MADLQTRLKDRGFDPGPADGDFGPNTDRAVRDFQGAHGLQADGIAGPQTWGQLNAVPAPASVAPAPAPAVNPDPEGLLPLNAGAPAPAPVAPYPVDGFDAAPPSAAPVAPGAPAVSGPVLAQGSQGPEVADLQTRLKDRGFDPGPADGDFGPNTDRAVRDFQGAHGLQVDGIAGPQTWGQLNAAPAPASVAPAPAPAVNPDPEGLLPLNAGASAPTPAPAPVNKPLLQSGATGADVVDLQNRLNARGYDVGLADGDFGPRTERAVKSFQGDQKLSQDGIVGPQTWSKLESTRPQAQGGAPGTTLSGTVTGSGGSVSVGPNGVSVSPKVDIKGPKGVGLSFSSEVSLNNDVKHEGGYTTVTAEGNVSISAGGSAQVGSVGVGGSVGRGTRTAHEVRMTDADYARYQRGEIAAPDPFKPSTMPPASSVRMDSQNYRSTELEASYHALAVKTGTTVSNGVSIQVDKLEGERVRVTAGPTEGVEQSAKLGLQAGPVGAFLGGTKSLDHYQLRTAEFDLGTPAGQDAYNRFLAKGDLPEQSAAGVSNPTKIEKLDYNASSSAELSLSVKALSLKLTAKGNSSGAEHITTTHEDGSKDVLTTVRYNDRTAVVDSQQDAAGNPKRPPELAVTLNRLHPEYAKWLEEVYTGSKPSLEGDQDVTLRFNSTEAMALRDAAYRSLRDLNAEWGIQGTEFEKQLADPYGTLQGNFNLRELARAKSFEDVATAMTAGITSAEGFTEMLLGLAIDSGLQLPGRIG